MQSFLSLTQLILPDGQSRNPASGQTDHRAEGSNGFLRAMSDAMFGENRDTQNQKVPKPGSIEATAADDTQALQEPETSTPKADGQVSADEPPALSEGGTIPKRTSLETIDPKLQSRETVTDNLGVPGNAPRQIAPTEGRRVAAPTEITKDPFDQPRQIIRPNPTTQVAGDQSSTVPTEVAPANRGLAQADQSDDMRKDAQTLPPAQISREANVPQPDTGDVLATADRPTVSTTAPQHRDRAETPLTQPVMSAQTITRSSEAGDQPRWPAAPQGKAPLTPSTRENPIVFAQPSPGVITAVDDRSPRQHVEIIAPLAAAKPLPSQNPQAAGPAAEVATPSTPKPPLNQDRGAPQLPTTAFGLVPRPGPVTDAAPLNATKPVEVNRPVSPNVMASTTVAPLGETDGMISTPQVHPEKLTPRAQQAAPPKANAKLQGVTPSDQPVAPQLGLDTRTSEKERPQLQANAVTFPDRGMPRPSTPIDARIPQTDVQITTNAQGVSKVSAPQAQAPSHSNDVGPMPTSARVIPGSEPLILRRDQRLEPVDTPRSPQTEQRIHTGSHPELHRPAPTINAGSQSAQPSAAIAGDRMAFTAPKRPVDRPNPMNDSLPIGADRATPSARQPTELQNQRPRAPSVAIPVAPKADGIAQNPVQDMRVDSRPVNDPQIASGLSQRPTVPAPQTAMVAESYAVTVLPQEVRPREPMAYVSAPRELKHGASMTASERPTGASALSPPTAPAQPAQVPIQPQPTQLHQPAQPTQVPQPTQFQQPAQPAQTLQPPVTQQPSQPEQSVLGFNRGDQIAPTKGAVDTSSRYQAVRQDAPFTSPETAPSPTQYAPAIPGSTAQAYGILPMIPPQALPAGALPDLPAEAEPLSSTSSFGTAEPSTHRLEAQVASLSQNTAPIRTNVVTQVIEAMAQQREGRVELQLAPEELGRVRLVFQGTEQAITVNLVAERPETMDLLRRNLDQLGSYLRDLGYRDVSFDLSSGGAHTRSGEHGGSSDGHTLTETAGQSTASLDVPPPTQLPITGEGGLDLRL